jgi:hypothetical protein
MDSPLCHEKQKENFKEYGYKKRHKLIKWQYRLAKT